VARGEEDNVSQSRHAIGPRFEAEGCLVTESRAVPTSDHLIAMVKLAGPASGRPAVAASNVQLISTGQIPWYR
jgi:hypothetical protein